MGRDTNTPKCVFNLCSGVVKVITTSPIIIIGQFLITTIAIFLRFLGHIVHSLSFLWINDSSKKIMPVSIKNRRQILLMYNYQRFRDAQYFGPKSPVYKYVVPVTVSHAKELGRQTILKNTYFFFLEAY